MTEPAAPRRDTYHHGDLRTALIAAAQAELGQSGLAGFSLRRVCARIGVRHSAAAHHFGDASGLLTAVAIEGFATLLRGMQARSADLTEPFDRVLASALAYVDFASGQPTTFRLIFGSDQLCGSAELEIAGAAAMDHFAAAILDLWDPSERAAIRATDWFKDRVHTAWATTHGFADLRQAGLLLVGQQDGGARLEVMLRRTLCAVLLLKQRTDAP
jgi:AcrR family transcriptional regulator